MIIDQLQIIENEARGRKVIFVEGESDRDAFQTFFERKFKETGRDFGNLYHVVDMGGKSPVLKALKKEPAWIGIVDRDTWDDGKIALEKKGKPNLIVLERYSIENYMIIPDELWEVIPGEYRTIVRGGFAEFKQEIQKDLNKWLRHGVLWHIIEPLFHGLLEEGFHYEFLEDVGKTATDEDIRKTLMKWHNFLAPDKILERFHRTLEEVMPLSAEEKLKRWIIGKEFFKHVVFPYFNRTFGQRKIKEYRKMIWEYRSISPDFDFMWEIIT